MVSTSKNELVTSQPDNHDAEHGATKMSWNIILKNTKKA